MEWLDIVDEHNRVVGRDTRDNIHANRLMHRAAHILLFNERGEVFVQLRSASKDVNPSLWDTSAAGHVDSGESYIACAVRELKEELGVHVRESEMHRVAQMPPSDQNGFEFIEVFRAVSEQAIVLEDGEVEDGRWLTTDALNDWIKASPEDFTQAFRTIWSMVE